MDAFIVDEDGDKAHRKRNGESLADFLGQSKHYRSKSASDKKLDIQRAAVSNSLQNLINETQQVLPPPKQYCEANDKIGQSVKSSPTNTNSSHRASLEKDIDSLQLRLQKEKSMRMMLERAMGRASSTLSPGHRHFATQAKELITEIESLEEEVANREQHVLSLYRSIFEHCSSQPQSEQSSGMISPAHPKVETRKHQSVISSSFCSSKKLPLQPLQTLSSINDLGGKSTPLHSKKRNVSLLSGKASIQFEKGCPTDHGKVQYPKPSIGKVSGLRTLKDHLNQCPSKLSEEMVKCMAAIYCWIRSKASMEMEQNRSPLLSRSSTNVLPRRGVGEERDWSCKSIIEISSISADKGHFYRVSYAINNYRLLVEQLERLNPSEMEEDAKIAFWINLHNSLVMHAYLAYGIPHHSLRRLALFHKAAYNINGHVISINSIEQSIFGFRTPRIGRWYDVILSTALKKRNGEERQLLSSKFRLPNPVPIVCFALCTGTISDPVLKVYTASNLQDELEAAKREFLQANIFLKKSKKVFLPKLIDRFAKESSISSDDLLNWVAENVDKKLQDAIMRCIDQKHNKKTSHMIEWLPYSWRFRYIFSKSLTEKTWNFELSVS
ncbi:uncharacterized protein LOC124910437 [Impatiens glandulifera]|uniref:uncharacterized protein LOC124910437 n=1 Tax=Impatiens glandulifera TaxID=253017 RepID=UPI001FB0CEF7|nr:uncharacterized protein LOC124910437 [Impatiens glandulifera]